MLIPETITPLPPFAHLAGRTVTTRPSRALRRRLRTPESLTVSQWAEKYRRVTEIDSKPGRWRNDLVPHAVPIMDSISKPWVRQVCICLPERGAKTQVLTNAVGWAKDQGSQSGNIFWLMPTEKDARDTLGERIIPVFKAKDDHNRPGRLARYLTGASDDTSRGLLRFNDGTRLFPAWANSPTSMAKYFGRINIADECDKFPERTSEGSDPITLFLKRARDDRHRSKYIFASTPAQRFIYSMTMACQQIGSWAMRCPDCDSYVLPQEEHIILDDEVTLATLNDADLALACPDCGSLWDEEKRAAAYHAGRAQIIHGLDVARPQTVGWHIPAWVFPNIPLLEIATALLKSRGDEHRHKVAWANGYAVTDYEAEISADRKKDHILKYRSEHPRNLAPADTARLALIADTQADHFYYQLWAYGYQPTINMHMVRHGTVQQFADLVHLLTTPIERTDGQQIPVSIGMIDSGGTRRGWQKHSRTVEVYDWCSRHKQMIPIKGVWSRADGAPITYKTIEVFPGTHKRIPGGLVRANIVVDLYKDELARLLAMEPDDQGALSFHADIDENFSAHYHAEIKDEHGVWIHDKKRGRNDYWDCNVYALALREILKTRIGKPPVEGEKEEKKTSTAAPRTAGGFVHGWKR